MQGCKVPDMIWNEMIWVKHKENEVSVDTSVDVTGNAGVLSPSKERTDRRLDDAAEEMVAPTGGRQPPRHAGL